MIFKMSFPILYSRNNGKILNFQVAIEGVFFFFYALDESPISYDMIHVTIEKFIAHFKREERHGHKENHHLRLGDHRIHFTRHFCINLT